MSFNYNSAAAEIQELLSYMDSNIDKVSDISGKLQQRIYELLLREIQLFDTENGRLVAKQDFKRRILLVESKIASIVGQQNYADVVQQFLSSFEQIESMNKGLQLKYNDIEVPERLVKPARQLIYDQAKAAMTKGLADSYVKPASYLLLNQVIANASIESSMTLLKNWNEGTVQSGRDTQGIRTPNLEKYATQLARDSAFQVNGTFNNIVKEEYKLTHFVYVGSIIKDSRPLCKHLVLLKRPIKYTELPPLIEAYPDGLYPNTTKFNFTAYRGGFSCRHQCLPVRG